MPIRRLYSSEFFLRITIGASLFVVLCMGGLAYRYITQLSESFEMVEHTYKVQLELEKTLLFLQDAESGYKGFLVSKDSVDLEFYVASRQELEQSLKHLEALISDNDLQQKSLLELETKIAKRLAIFNDTSNRFQKDSVKGEFITAYKEGRQQTNSIRFKINEMINHEKELLNARREKSAVSLSNAPLYVYYILIFFLTLLLLTYHRMSKNIKVLKKRNEQLLTSHESSAQSEIISKHGNWVWHIRDNSFEYSDNLYRLLGESPQSFEPTLVNFLSFVHPEDIDKLTAHLDKMLDEEDLPFIYYRIIQKNGTIRHFKSYGKALVNSEDEKRLLGTTSDITDEIESFRLLEHKNVQLMRNNKELASFNYVASHDLQEPLRKIQTFISRMEVEELKNLSDNGKLYMERIKSASIRMRALIDDLLQFSRTTKFEEVFEVSNMNQLIESVKSDLTETISEKKAIITSDNIPAMQVIPFQIKQLFYNLICNSLKYSKEDVAPVIHISYAKTNASDLPQIKSTAHKKYHTITVKDNGIGFDQSFSDQIFVLFNRLHNKNEYSGTGIGLSICKKIVENHNGHIFAEGQTNEGATFTVCFPIT